MKKSGSPSYFIGEEIKKPTSTKILTSQRFEEMKILCHPRSMSPELPENNSIKAKQGSRTNEQTCRFSSLSREPRSPGNASLRLSATIKSKKGGQLQGQSRKKLACFEAKRGQIVANTLNSKHRLLKLAEESKGLNFWQTTAIQGCSELINRLEQAHELAQRLLNSLNQPSFRSFLELKDLQADILEMNRNISDQLQLQQIFLGTKDNSLVEEREVLEDCSKHARFLQNYLGVMQDSVQSVQRTEGSQPMANRALQSRPKSEACRERERSSNR